MQLKVSNQNLYVNCFEGVLASVALYLNRHYEWMYLNEWKFRFNPLPIGSRYRLGLALELHRDKVGPLIKFHGIRYRQYPCEDLDKLRDILKGNLAERMPIAVRADVYHCSWDKSFKKYHNPNHIFLINGLEEQTSHFICSDPFYQEWNRPVSVEEFVTMFTGQYGVFEITEDISFLIDGVKAFRDMLKSLYVEATFDAIRKLAEEVETADFAQEIQRNTAVWFTPFYRRMLEIAHSRSRLPRFVTFVAEQYKNTEMLRPLPLLEEISEGWQQVKDLTLKLLMNENQILQNRLAYKINNLANMEEIVVLTLLSI